ncbi:MAG: HAD family hydrolase [Pirellulales bacterium]|nr:HAD family hydrolase [Pirellulales bacterium]
MFGGDISRNGPLRPVRGLLFDFGNVLYDNTAWRRWLLSLLGRFGLRADYQAFYRIWDREYSGDVHSGHCHWATAFRTFLISFGVTGAQLDEVMLACQAQQRRCEATARPLPNVRSTLAQLDARGLKLAILADSRSPASDLHRLLDRLALGNRFVSVLGTCDVGHAMPDPAGYLASLAAMGLAAEEVAFVGHNAVTLVGAAEVGMQTVAFNHEPDALADAYLDRFGQLLDLIHTPAHYAAAS